MDNQSETRAVPRSFWIIGIAALVWNALGIVTYLMSVMISPEALSQMPEAERALYSNVPAWVTAAYAIAVFGGTLASIALLMRKRWAFEAFVVSLVAIIVQMSHALLMSEVIVVKGVTAAILPLLIVVVAAFLVWYSYSARKKGWIG